MRTWLAAAVLATSAVASPARAEDAETALRAATARVQRAAADVPSIEQTIAKHRRTARTAEKQIADAVLLMGVKDYDRAADVLNQVVERYKDHPTAFADGLNLLGETYFESKQYLSARRVFDRILDDQDKRFAPYRERAAIRLVDVALRLKEFDTLDDLFARIGAVQGAQSGLSYAKAKGLIAQNRLGAAATALSGVAADSAFNHQAKYLAGVIAVKEAAVPAAPEGEAPKPVPAGTYAKAVDAFRAVTKLEPDTEEHRHVIDMAWLAIGRLLYESSQFSEAVEAYNRIDRSSPEFGTMLYELAWVYVRLGDVVRAQRALEVLSVADPNSQDVADASLLRGDLMLRAGQFEKARKVYESVRGTYEDMRGRLDDFLGQSDDPGVYFDTLSQDQLELFEAGRALPPLVLRWAREGEDGERAFAIIDDIGICRRLIKESNEMIERLNAVLASPNRIRALPELKVGAERALSILNALAMARLSLGGGLDDVEENVSGQLGQVRAQRQALERRLALVPVTAADFEGREQDAQRQWNKASQGLHQLELEVDTLQATVNGLERMLKDGPEVGVVRSPAQIQQFEASLLEQRRLLKYYRDQISQLRRGVEAGKVQVGFGDQRFVEDAQVRAQYRQLLAQEVAMSAQGQGGNALAAYARRVQPILTQADQTEAVVEASLAKIDREVQEKTTELRSIVQSETANIVEYSLQLEELDKEARVVVGEVARRNFGRVRERLRNIVLRADVGITEEAWELREEQYTRVRRLKIERARGEQRLQEELEEVLDDSSDPEAP
ncbi:MAG: tetratricopeptide repeat protein [Polyangiaceae bacterium]